MGFTFGGSSGDPESHHGKTIIPLPVSQIIHARNFQKVLSQDN